MEVESTLAVSDEDDEPVADEPSLGQDRAMGDGNDRMDEQEEEEEEEDEGAATGNMVEQKQAHNAQPPLLDEPFLPQLLPTLSVKP